MAKQVTAMPCTKAGQSIGAKGSVVQVNFGSAFSSVPRVVLTPHSNNPAWITEVSVSYFKWENSSNKDDVTVDWKATDADNI